MSPPPFPAPGYGPPSPGYGFPPPGYGSPPPQGPGPGGTDGGPYPVPWTPERTRRRKRRVRDPAQAQAPLRGGGVLDEAWRLAGDFPLRAVDEAWSVLIGVSAGVLGEHFADAERATAPEMVRRLERVGLPPDAVSAFDQLRDLRNRALHGAGDVTPAAARDFIESCLAVIRVVERLG
ncbi:hypothetical protein [Streptomyces zingiberis]|uniref:DUF4145 domain-containing protein n=1 Tax=Streptomyces zingiberis TaxID=2053010 RepID=A0ABX1BZB8_9ACTN|nr:hypothetical protein [Streptomyces zingiberis]NJQ00852.1 hypothetical protein [Streptomyces zingiberis]